MYPGMILSEAMYVREIEEPPTKFTLLTYNIQNLNTYTNKKMMTWHTRVHDWKEMLE